MDGPLLLREIEHIADEDAPNGAPGIAITAHEPTISVTVGGPAGDRQTFTVPRSVVAGQTDMGTLLRRAMDHDSDGGSDDPGELARRRTFINQVRAWMPRADNAHYSMMLARGDGGETAFIEPGTPVDISRHQDQDRSFFVSFAQVYTGGGE